MARSSAQWRGRIFDRKFADDFLAGREAICLLRKPAATSLIPSRSLDTGCPLLDFRVSVRTSCEVPGRAIGGLGVDLSRPLEVQRRQRKNAAQRRTHMKNGL